MEADFAFSAQSRLSCYSRRLEVCKYQLFTSDSFKWLKRCRRIISSWRRIEPIYATSALQASLTVFEAWQLMLMGTSGGNPLSSWIKRHRWRLQSTVICILTAQYFLRWIDHRWMIVQYVVGIDRTASMDEHWTEEWCCGIFSHAEPYGRRETTCWDWEWRALGIYLAMLEAGAYIKTDSKSCISSHECLY